MYDTFLLLHQEAETQQSVSQDFRQAALNAVRQMEGELVANLQSNSTCLANNTRGAYRIIFLDYKVFPRFFFFGLLSLSSAITSANHLCFRNSAMIIIAARLLGATRWTLARPLLTSDTYSRNGHPNILILDRIRKRDASCWIGRLLNQIESPSRELWNPLTSPVVSSYFYFKRSIIRKRTMSICFLKIHF